jgi:RimJ/RimL family protein N-acetyltransferase
MADVPVPTLPISLSGITLRRFGRADYDQFCAYWCRPDVARYVPWRPNDRAGARDALNLRAADHELRGPGDRLRLAVIADERIAGEVMLAWEPGDNRQGEVGFALHPDFHGRGIAYTAARQMLRLGFDEIGLHRIVGNCDPRNHPSAALLQRLGLRPEGHLRETRWLKDEWVDTLVFGLLEQEWRDQPS